MSSRAGRPLEERRTRLRSAEHRGVTVLQGVRIRLDRLNYQVHISRALTGSNRVELARVLPATLEIRRWGAGIDCQRNMWSSFRSFKDRIEHEERFFHSQEIQEFLAEVLATACDRVESIRKGQRYWRAQPGSALRPPDNGGGQIVDYCCVPHLPERMKPLPEKAREGRVNSRGIPCLYLATD